MIKIKHNSKVFMLLPKWVEAITLGSTIHVKGSSIDNDLLRHEMVHVEQIKKDGIVKFYSLYVFHYLKNLVKHRDFKLAYKLIPYEVEACDAWYNSHKFDHECVGGGCIQFKETPSRGELDTWADVTEVKD